MVSNVMPKRHTTLRTCWRVIIIPWPRSLVWFAALLLLGGLAPFGQIWATTHLVNTLAAQIAAGPLSEHALWSALVPNLVWIAVFGGSATIGFVVSMNIIQPAVATYHAECIVAYWMPQVLTKAARLHLEQFERPAYFDAVQRARDALNAERIALQHSQFQRVLARLSGCVGIVWALTQVHWLLGAMLAVSSVAITAWRLHRGRALVSAQRRQTPLQRRRDYWRDLLIQRSAAAEIRLFALEDYCLQRWRALALHLHQELTHVRMGTLWREIPLSAAHIGVFSLGSVGLLLVAQQHALTPGGFVASLLAIQQFLDLMQNFSRVDTIQQVISELMAVPAFLALEGNEPSDGLPAPRLVTDGIRFCDVGFTYPGSDQPALAGIHLLIRPGERIALVGENGAGKSTFARLLLGLYRPSTGQITIEGSDLQQIDPTSWRTQTAAVFQDYVRYMGSARDNIGYGQLARREDNQAIQVAAHTSGASAVVAQLPNGYATLLGAAFDGGVELSGGQWQTFAIARAYLRDAPILVLDEPAAALDALAEQAVYHHFLSLATDKTVLLISHRLGSARLADRIVFLDHGRVVQIGTHDALMEAGGAYAELYAMQAAWYQDTEAVS